MRDVMKDLLIALLGTWILERLPGLALAIVRLAARLMPTPELRAQMHDGWTADVMTAGGPLSMLVVALFTLCNVPSIRQGHGYRTIPSSVHLNEIGARLTNFAMTLGSLSFILSQIYMLICRSYILPVLSGPENEDFAASLSELSSTTSVILFLTLANVTLHRVFLGRLRRRITK